MEFNKSLINCTRKKLIAHNPDKFQKEDLSKLGRFEVVLVTSKLTFQKFVAVKWIDVDDDSYTAFFEAHYPNPMIYLYYEN